MNVAERRRQNLTSRRKSEVIDSALLWQIMLLALFFLMIVAWIGTAVHLLAKDEHNNNSRLKGTATSSRTSSMDNKQHDAALDMGHDRMVALEVQVDSQRTITVRIAVSYLECPKAYEFLTWMVENQSTECRPCTIYRGEPVPSYWGSTDYPDRWDNGGRWGPPYALVQGGFPNRVYEHVEREAHRPPVRRGSVAWAGARGVHFFVALADHPEWGHEHTVWGRVEEEDMPMLDTLVDGSRSLTVLERNVPVVTNFADPMP
mmetsp:Transcript_5165/g.11196  ORF Transcript_5165/g.11196 Transcript_5165/m.11196 type:complete len:260 (-) Transcript_5165:546-1325(-)